MPDEPIYTFLAIPDDPWWSKPCPHLSLSGFAIVGQASNSLAVWTRFRETCPHLVIVATWLLDNDVLTLCRAIHRLSPSITIILATTGEDSEQLAPLEAGVSCYISLDFSLTTWPSLLTRSTIFPPVTLKQALDGALSTHGASKMVTIGPYLLIWRANVLPWRERRIRSTRREYAILVCLAESSGLVATFDQLFPNIIGISKTHAHLRIAFLQACVLLGHRPHQELQFANLI